MMVILINAIDVGFSHKHYRLCLNRIFVGFASAAWSNVASTAMGATCEMSSWHGPHGCTCAIDGHLTPHLSWIPQSDEPKPWLKVRYFGWVHAFHVHLSFFLFTHTLRAGDLVPSKLIQTTKLSGIKSQQNTCQINGVNYDCTLSMYIHMGINSATKCVSELLGYQNTLKEYTHTILIHCLTTRKACHLMSKIGLLSWFLTIEFLFTASYLKKVKQ